MLRTKPTASVIAGRKRHARLAFMCRLAFVTFLVTCSAGFVFAKPVVPDILRPTPRPTDPPSTAFIRTGPTIQLAILLDTSNSMDGLISQARTQLWTIVNELTKANKNGRAVAMEVGIFEYGNARLSSHEGYIRLVQPFTTDLDLVSEKLFSLTTNGGDEYAGQVIKEAVNRLQWSQHPDDLRLVLIAGNESFRQGSVPFDYAIRQATKRDIIVNTIFCGSRQEGINLAWASGAQLGNGKYMAIQQDDIYYVDTPYDNDLIRLNARLNSTYTTYNAAGVKKKSRQYAQDTNAQAEASSVLAARSVSKTRAQYQHQQQSWDLVSQFTADPTDALQKAAAAPSAYLPTEIAGKSEAEISSYLKTKAQEREDVTAQIAKLEKQREEYLESAADRDAQDFGSAVKENIRDLASSHGFMF